MTETIKNLTELVPGDVIIDPQGSPNVVQRIVPEHKDADEWEDAYDGFRIFTDRMPMTGQLVVPAGAPETVKFRILLSASEITQ